MTRQQTPFQALALLFLAGLLTACGSGEPRQVEIPEFPEVEVPLVSEPVTLHGEDFTGIEERNVSFTLHWVGGPVNRDPSPDVDPVALQEVVTQSTGSFDRMIFRFADGAFPGYELAWVEGEAINCSSGQPVSVGGERHLELRLRGVTAGANVARSLQPGHPNLLALSPTCAQGGEVVWRIGVQESAEVRVIEMREPRRLVVDVRHPGATTP